MIEVYRKRGRVARWENGWQVRVAEHGEAIEDGETFRCHPLGGLSVEPAILPVLGMTARAERLILTDGFADHEFIGRTSLETPIAREVAERYFADDMTVIQTGEPVINRQEPYVLKDGRSGWLLTSKYPTRDSQGRVTGLVGIARDVTEYKRTGEELSTMRARLGAHLDHMLLAIMELDADLRVVRWAGRAAELFGWEEEEALGRAIRHAVVFTMTRAIKSKQHTAIEKSLRGQGVDIVTPPLMERAAFSALFEFGGDLRTMPVQGKMEPAAENASAFAQAVYNRLVGKGL